MFEYLISGVLLFMSALVSYGRYNLYKTELKGKFNK